MDLLFAPADEEVYPDGFDTTVTVGGVGCVLEGDPGRRGPGHFAGVATVVTKLFNMAGPDVAYFGQKDAQQALVIRSSFATSTSRCASRSAPRCATPTGSHSAPATLTCRATSASERWRSSRALRAAEARSTAASATPPPCCAPRARSSTRAGIEPEYLELRSAHDLSPVERVNGSTLLAVAARIGRARLIDNVILAVTGSRSHTA